MIPNELQPITKPCGNKRNPFLRKVCNEGLWLELTNGDLILIPEGFITDMASVPRSLWSFVSPWGRDELAFILHDYLYWTKGANGRYTRKFSDDQMTHYQTLAGVKRWRIKTMRWAVRAWGWTWWNGRDKGEEKAEVITYNERKTLQK